MSILLTFVSLLFRIIELAILVQCIMSFVVRGGNPIMDTLRAFTAPILNPFRAIQEKIFGQVTIDFSPILAIIFLDFLRGVIFSILL